MIQTAIELAERGHLPDRLIRFGVRRMLATRLREEAARDCERSQERLEAWLERVRSEPVAVEPEAANAQHYRNGQEWRVAHYLMSPRATATAGA